MKWIYARKCVLLPYEFTLLSNNRFCRPRHLIVLLPYEFTLLSNYPVACRASREFYYLMNLHYSQTLLIDFVTLSKFYYLMNLHYSQTSNESKRQPLHTAGYFIKQIYYISLNLYFQQFHINLYQLSLTFHFGKAQNL